MTFLKGKKKKTEAPMLLVDMNLVVILKLLYACFLRYLLIECFLYAWYC